MNKDQHRRLCALEASRGVVSKGTAHQIIWGVGMSWSEVAAAHDDGERIQPGDHVLLYRLVDSRPDPVRARDQPISEAWLQEKGVIPLLGPARPSRVGA